MGGVRRSEDDHAAALITTAPQNSGDEFDKRKKKYAIMMATRALCVLLAATTYRVSLTLAMVFVIAGAVLPWCAVLIANDRPPKRRHAELGYVSVPVERALPAGTDERVVDG
jgi:Flp pilus assembly protein TadB